MPEALPGALRPLKGGGKGMREAASGAQMQGFGGLQLPRGPCSLTCLCCRSVIVRRAALSPHRSRLDDDFVSFQPHGPPSTPAHPLQVSGPLRFISLGGLITEGVSGWAAVKTGFLKRKYSFPLIALGRTLKPYSVATMLRFTLGLDSLKPSHKGLG